MSTLLIMAGGTGGHVFPAIAVARYLRTQGVNIVWLGTRRGLEATAVPAAGFEIEWINIRGLKRGGVRSWLLLPFRLLFAMIQAWRVIRRRKPAAVLAMGGFVAGPGGLVARLMRTPLLVHEQNAIAGVTNRWLALIASDVMCGFPQAFGVMPGTHHVGNPVRPEILEIAKPEVRYAVTGKYRLLILGGSQGAQALNTVIPQALQLLTVIERPEVWHQTGKQQERLTQETYQNLAIEAKVTAFIDDMAAAYQWANLVICRAGAMTISELSAAGLAAILVPFPFATDDHQTANARFLVERNAAILLPETELNAPHLAELLRGFASIPDVLLKMALNARSCAMPDATVMVARHCMEKLYA